MDQKQGRKKRKNEWEGASRPQRKRVVLSRQGQKGGSVRGAGPSIIDWEVTLKKPFSAGSGKARKEGDGRVIKEGRGQGQGGRVRRSDWGKGGEGTLASWTGAENRYCQRRKGWPGH